MSEKGTATKTALETVPASQSAQPSWFEEFDRMYETIARRAFELFQGNGKETGHELDDWLKAEAELLHPLKVNMTESDAAIAVQAEVPGFSDKDLDIRIEHGQLTISGKRETSEEQKKGKSIYQEHRSNQILRTFTLPAEVDASKATATLKNGMLELNMPKSERARGTRIQIKAA